MNVLIATVLGQLTDSEQAYDMMTNCTIYKTLQFRFLVTAMQEISS